MMRYGVHELDEMYLRSSVLPRVRKYVKRQGNCLIWTGAKTAYRDGAPRYGVIRVRTASGRPINVYVHRLLALIKYGDNERNAALQVDHVCLNTFCVRADHMEFVTPKVNTNRGRAGSGKPRHRDAAGRFTTGRL